MIDSYINIDKSHKSFDKAFVDLGLNKLVLKNITNSNQINLVVTSLAKYGETKKNLSDFESTNKSFPTLIIVDDKDFEQTIDLIQNHLYMFGCILFVLLRYHLVLDNHIQSIFQIHLIDFLRNYNLI